MSTVCRHGDILKVGNNFVDAVTGRLRAQGKITMRGGMPLTWVSTLPIAETERILRRSAQLEARTVTYFESQSVGS